MRQVRDTTNDIKREINESVSKHGLDNNIVEDINKEVNDVKDNIDKLTGPIKRNR